MKVGEIKKIMDKFEYNGICDKGLLRLSDNDIKLVINNLENRNSENLLNFLISYTDSKYDFERLEIKDIKENIISKILNSKSMIWSEVLVKIYNYDLSKFQTKEEWFKYFNNITEDNIILLSSRLDNLDYVLSNIKTNREGAIEKVLSLSPIIDLNKDKDKISELDGTNFTDYLDLLLLKYNSKSSIEFIKRKDEITSENYYNGLNYLKNPKLTNRFLPNVFISVDEKEYSSIIDLLNKITDDNLLQHYIFTDVPKKQQTLFKEYIEKTVDSKTESLKKAYLRLLDSGYISCLLNMRPNYVKYSSNKNKFINYFNEYMVFKRIAEITEILEKFDKEDSKAVEMANMINILPYEICKKIPLNVNKEVLNQIYNNIKLFDIIYMVNAEELFNLTEEEIKCFIGILKTESFNKLGKNTSEEIKILKNKNNVSLQQLYELYLKEDKKLLEKQRQEILEQQSKIEINKIIENMSDDEEITMNVLTYKYTQ